jgi:hypothetical protein
MSIELADENGNAVSKEVYEEFLGLKTELADAMDNRDEDKVIQTLAKLEEFATKHNLHLSSPITVKPDVPIDEKPDEGLVKPGGWGANTDAKTWKIATMVQKPNLFKIVDDKDVNVATDFTTQAKAQYYIDYYNRNVPVECPPGHHKDPAGVCVPDIIVEGDKDQFGILKIKPDGPGKVFETKFDLEFKIRNYNSGKPSEPSLENTNTAAKAVKNQEATMYCLIKKFKDADDTASFKIEGGPHSSSNPKTGHCYDCQLNVNGGNGNTLEVEDPHPSMHPCHQKSNFKVGERWVGKWMGIKMLCYTINGGKDRHLEMLLDYPVPDIAAPPNKWRTYWSVDDTGQLPHGHIIEPIGNRTTMRIDGVPKNEAEFKYASVREIVGL